MRIGCVKEIKKQEYRVGMTPDNAAGYTAAAKILKTAEEVWNMSEMLIKVKEPLPQEYSHFHRGLILYTYLHLAAAKELTEALLKAGVKAAAYETLMEKMYGGRACSSAVCQERPERKS